VPDPRHRWDVDCRDVFGRRAVCRIALASNGQIMLASPPGEVALLNQHAASVLARVLREAAWGGDSDNPLDRSVD
jgi:hypothetical protein